MTTLWRVRHTAGQIAGTRGRLVPLVGWKAPERRTQVVRRESAVCIEGFQRSGNWFAVRTFSRANPGRIPIAHHVHHSGQVKRAVAFRVPCAVLIREPTAAVGSLLVFEPRLTVRMALKGYLRFYEAVARNAEEVTICPFEELIEDPGSLLVRLNERYGSDFAIPAASEPERTAIFGEIERLHPGLPVEKLSTPRPERASANMLARQRAAGDPRISSAIGLYRELVAHAGERH